MPARVLQTARLTLRGWRDADVDSWFELNSDPRVMEFFPSAFDRARADASAARLRADLDDRGYGWWIAEDRETKRFAGAIALVDVPFEAHFTPATEVGWRLLPEYWGRGYATEGGRAAIEFGFDELRRPEIVSVTAIPNQRSQRVMQRLGMTRDPLDDFEHPYVPEGHPLRMHVLYRLKNPRSKD